MSDHSCGQPMPPQQPSKQTATAPPLNLCRSQAPLGNASREALLRIPPPATALRTNAAPRSPAPEHPSKKKNIVIPEFSARLASVLERCRAENIRNLPRQRAPTPSFPERRSREACSMPLSGRHDLPLATFKKPKPLVSSLPRFVQRRLAVVQQLRDRQNLSIRRNGGKMRIIPAFFAYCRNAPKIRLCGTLYIIPNCLIRAIALCPAKRRFAFSPMAKGHCPPGGGDSGYFPSACAK